MNNYIATILAVVITAAFPIICIVLVRCQIKNAPTAEHYLSVLRDPSASAEQQADAFCSLIHVDYVCTMAKTNNGGKYNDNKHVQRFMRSVNSQRLSRINNVVDKMNSERVVLYEYN